MDEGKHNDYIVVGTKDESSATERLRKEVKKAVDKQKEFVRRYYDEKMDKSRRECVALLAEHFKISKEQAEEDYEGLARRHFKAAAQPIPASHKPLGIPDGDVPKFHGKPAEVYKFLLDTYVPRQGAQPLTLAFLHEHDKAAVKAFRSRRRSEPVPPELSVLTEEGHVSKTLAIIAKYRVDMDSESGRADAAKLASAIKNLLYG